MPCYHPLKAWRSKRAISLKTGKPVIFFKEKYVKPFPKCDREELQLPCGRCFGCRLERSRQWAIRCVHEASLHDENCFITLTYRDECLPKNSSLDYSDFQKFMKRLRKLLSAAVGQAKRVSYYMCGEYGENFGRPHFHACLFGFNFPDLKFFDKREGVILYTSELLSKLWPYGFSTVGEVTFESAAYVARYVMKKVTGELAEVWYDGRKPEFNKMSLKPAIGKDWINGYKDYVYSADSVTMLGGFESKPPRYYDKQYEIANPEHFGIIKEVRKREAGKSPHNSPERLRVREKIKKAQISKLKRGLK